jgi:MFS family permease
MVPGSLAIIAKAYPADERGRAIGIWAAASALTTTGGPILGGFVLSAGGDASWRLIFAINLPLGMFALSMLWWRVPPDTAEICRKIDWIGGALITVSLFLFAYGMTGAGGEGSVPEGGRALLFAMAGLVFLAAFIAVEARVADPMVPLRLFSITAFSGANVLTFFLYFGLSAVLFYLPMTVISAWGLNAAQVAIAFVPLGASIALLSGWAGTLSDRYGPAPLISAGSVVVAVSFLGLALSAPYQNLWFHVIPLMVLGGIGMSLVVSPLSAAVMTSVTDADTGTASGVNNAVSRVSGLFAVAIMGLAASLVHSYLVAGSGQAEALAGISFGSEFEGDGAATEAHRSTTNRAFATVALIVSIMSMISAVVAWKTLGHGPANDKAGLKY